MGGGGAAGVQTAIEADRPILSSVASEIGITAVTGSDAAFVFERRKDAERLNLQHLKQVVIGKRVRDYVVTERNLTIWPHSDDFSVVDLAQIPDIAKYLWPLRAAISHRKRFGTRMLERGLSWYEFQELYTSKLIAPLTITFACVATHNHFVLERGNMLFNSKAPVIKLPLDASEDNHLDLLGLLNSSTACFWIKQVCHNKGSQGINEGAKAEAWERFIEANSTRIEQFPIALDAPLSLVREIDALAERFAAHLPAAICAAGTPSRESLDVGRVQAEMLRASMISLQEELDWYCYRLYGLIEDAHEHPDPPPLRLGERAFEIVMARRMEPRIWKRRGSSAIARHRSLSSRRIGQKAIARWLRDALP